MTRRAAPHRGIDAHYGDADDGARPSKTKLKEHSHALQALGAQLAALPAERLAAVEMPDDLRAAIDEWRQTRSHEGRRRQMQYIGKLMRHVDEAPLREAVAAAALGGAIDALRPHDTERWRDELIADDAALARWLEAHPATDAQRLRSLVRAARRDAAGLAPEDRKPRSVRELFLFLKPHLGRDPAATP
jgi:ribosome-associated protein